MRRKERPAPPDKIRMELTMNIGRMENIIEVFGSFDENLRYIENALSVRINDRDSELHISGEPCTPKRPSRACSRSPRGERR